MNELAETIMKELTEQTYECMICYDNIKRAAPVWSCSTCFTVFHLDCARKWARSCSDGSQSDNKIVWRCPGCQALNSSLPKAYRCFCGKEHNPYWTPTGPPPHTCGEICGKKRKATAAASASGASSSSTSTSTSSASTCNHHCNIPCHPGPCPPCPVVVERKCYCGRSGQKLRCSADVKEWSCGNKCAKLLNCKIHVCQEACHPGPCARCDKPETQRCYGGHATREALCGEGTVDHSQGERRHYACDATCGRTLDCGAHTCDKGCHPGPCAPCPTSPAQVSTCPCGHMPLRALMPTPRTACTDPIPTCASRCGKLLPCSSIVGHAHHCGARCHTGACPPCTAQVEISCRCGRSKTTVACESIKSMEDMTFVCAKPCSHMKNCGRHRCMELCCPAANVDGETVEHDCMLPCNKLLPCGKCRCELLCHRGYCPRCMNTSFQELHCTCGKTVMEPPIPCGAKPPKCDFPCSRPHDCDHPVNHKCHYDEEKCAPCTVLVSRMCVGNHEVRPNIKCHVKEVFCGKPCDKPLVCGIHKCPVACHKGPCDNLYPRNGLTDAQLTFPPRDAAWADGEDGEGGDGEGDKAKDKQASAAAPETWESLAEIPPSCGLKCGMMRACGHGCEAACHPGRECPPALCKVLVPVTCPCGARKGTAECGYSCGALPPGTSLESFLAAAAAGGATSSKVTIRQDLPCDHRCTLLSKARAQELRNRALADAFGLDITAVDLSGHISHVYSDFLMDKARKQPAFVANIEKIFEEFVGNPAAKQYAFGVMKKDDRQVIHELAEHYGVHSVSQDPEPNRNVVMYKSDVRPAKCPVPLLSQAAAKK